MPTKEPRLTIQSLKVLNAFLKAKGYRACGADIVQMTNLFPGTAYPILARLKEAGWLTGEWEVANATEKNRPPRLYYTLTGVGQRVALEKLSEIGIPNGATTWAR
jgi:PadR family transcriptional regulator PadR